MDATRRLLPGGLLALSLTAMLVGAFSGCASSGYLSLRRMPRNPLDFRLTSLRGRGPRPTPRTEQLLRRYDLIENQKKDGEQVLEKLQLELVTEPTAEKTYSYAELSYVEGRRAEQAGDLSKALDGYGAAVAHAYHYLFDPRFDGVRNPYDPQFRGASNLYNVALEAAIRIVNDQGKLKPGETQVVHTPERDYLVEVVVRGPWHNDDFERFEFASDFEVTGLRNHIRRYGLGVPLIAVRRKHEDENPGERFYPPGLSFAVTAFLRVLPHNDHSDGEATRRCVLELYDPVVSQNIQVTNRLVPLESDLSTPLAFFLDNPASAERRNVATLGLLDPNKTQELTGLYMVEPYDPNKIPVIMVHGLWSSPVTWMEMFNDLRSFPEIRDNFQFWFYMYPTGQPFWLSATRMREDLAEARRTLDPQRTSRTLDQLVLVGHSMGGLVSNMQVIYSGQEFWNILSDKPFSELKADAEIRSRISNTLFFEPNPAVRRVVTIGTPHRGSEFANDYTRWLGRKLIALPTSLLQNGQRLVRQNPDLFRDTQLLTTTTSIDSLAADSPILPVILNATKSPWVKRHNIVGVVADRGIVGRLSSKGDGIVSYDSAHLDGVDSEIEVEADHVTVHQHARAILEVRRVLREHRVQMIAEADAARTQMATHGETLNPTPHPSDQRWNAPRSVPQTPLTGAHPAQAPGLSPPSPVPGSLRVPSGLPPQEVEPRRLPVATPNRPPTDPPPTEHGANRAELRPVAATDNRQPPWSAPRYSLPRTLEHGAHAEVHAPRYDGSNDRRSVAR